MRTDERTTVRLSFVTAAMLLLTAVVLGLAACGGTEPTAQVIVVTATYTPESVVRVATATFTPAPESEASATPLSQGGGIATPEATVTLAVPGAAQLPEESPTPFSEATSQGPELASTASGPVIISTAPPPSATPGGPPPTEAAANPTAKPAVKPVSLGAYFVVYTAYKGPDLQDYSLWGMGGDGSDVFQIEGAGQASEPAFSPDGNKFAFYHWTDGLYIWDLNRNTSLHLVQDGNASFPTWSSNGQRLAYFVAAGTRWIYIVNADGSDNHQLTPGMRPYWSLAGGFIGYDTCENNKCGIFRINPDGKGKRQLTADSGGGPAVSPDGKRIAYWSQADGDFEIYLINADGSGKKQLTKNQGNDALPAWSPDGKQIYYLSDQNGKGWAVMVMNPDGTNPRRIAKTSAGADPARGWQYQRITVTWNE